MLTRKQHELLLFINRRLEEDGVSPSFDEMKDALGLKSKSGIHRLITGLEERGFIRRLPHRARALEVLRLPDAIAYGEKGTGGSADIVQLATPRPSAPASSGEEDEEHETVQLPLYGKIAAGTPITALRDHSEFVQVPAALLARGDHYALTVEGDSMIEAGILDGDTVVIRRCDTAENGAIVVALVDGEEVTLKRLRRKGDSIALEPANKDYETRIFGPDRVSVQGRIAALIRAY
jgi:repressor LexA